MEVTDSEFQKAVKEYVNADPENNVRKLANDARVSLPTVRRWAQGKSRPHPIARPSIIACINRLKQ